MIGTFTRRLTFLFTAATSAILTLVLGVSFFYQFRITGIQDLEHFQNQLLDLTHRLEGSSSLTDSWLAKLEADGHLIIHIEDNQIPLFFSGSWNPPTSRETLIRLAKEKALAEHVDTAVRPFSNSLNKTSIFTLKGEHGDTYRGNVLILSTENGFRSMILLEDTTVRRRALYLQTFVFCLLELFGILALYLISRHVIKKAALPIEEYHQKQTDFVAAASHELRSPLAVIQAGASAAAAAPGELTRMITLIQAECTRAGNLIRNLLLLASADSGSLGCDMQPLEIDSLLLKLYESYEPLCLSRNIHLLLVLPDEFLPMVSGNRQWIYQILSILLDNAIAYGCSVGEKPILQIKAETDRTHVALSVTDHGPGIAEEKKSFIFDRFYRGDSSRHDKDHTGLGLSIAQTLAGQMNCSVTLTDTPGGGCTFQIALPAIT